MFRSVSFFRGLFEALFFVSSLTVLEANLKRESW